MVSALKIKMVNSRDHEFKDCQKQGKLFYSHFWIGFICLWYNLMSLENASTIL
jgi:hypothetical protein